MSQFVEVFDWREKVPTIVVCGPISVGKDTAIQGLKSAGIEVFSSGNYLRQQLNNDNASPGELFSFGKSLQDKCGSDILARMMLKKAQERFEREEIKGIIFNGPRRYKEYTFMRDNFGAHTIYLDAPRWLRLLWFNRRNQERGLDILKPRYFELMDKEQLRELERIKESVGVELIENKTKPTDLIFKVRASVSSRFPNLL